MFRVGGKSVATEVGHRKRIHTTWDDKSELIEEYDNKTLELLLRKRRRAKQSGSQGAWEYIQGEDGPGANAECGALRESSLNPQLSRKDTKEAFLWRIRNLPYPSDTYALSVDADTLSIVVRTSNKKYFKKIHVPELEILKLGIHEKNLQWQHSNNTLIITYKKPPTVREADTMELKALLSFNTGAEHGSTDCKQQ